MRQRNDTPHAWSFAATPATETDPEVPPFVVEPGGIVDRPTLLDGWTAVDDSPEPDTDKTDKQPAARKRAAAEDAKGGEPK